MSAIAGIYRHLNPIPPYVVEVIGEGRPAGSCRCCRHVPLKCDQAGVVGAPAASTLARAHGRPPALAAAAAVVGTSTPRLARRPLLETGGSGTPGSARNGRETGDLRAFSMPPWWRAGATSGSLEGLRVSEAVTQATLGGSS